jgi:hypothetical protein
LNARASCLHEVLAFIVDSTNFLGCGSPCGHSISNHSRVRSAPSSRSTSTRDPREPRPQNSVVSFTPSHGTKLGFQTPSDIADRHAFARRTSRAETADLGCALDLNGVFHATAHHEGSKPACTEHATDQLHYPLGPSL